MSNSLKPQHKDFYTSTARLRNTPEFKDIMSFLSARQDALREQLVGASPADFAVMQGRAREINDIIDILTKTKETA